MEIYGCVCKRDLGDIQVIRVRRPLAASAWKCLAICLSVGLALSVSGCATMSGSEKAAVGAAAADVATTAYALLIEEGFEESNPLISQNSDAETVAVGLATTLAMHFLLRWLAQKWGVDVALWAPYASVRGVAAVLNVEEIVESKQ